MAVVSPPWPVVGEETDYWLVANEFATEFVVICVDGVCYYGWTTTLF